METNTHLTTMQVKKLNGGWWYLPAKHASLPYTQPKG